jgi:tRNA (cmo5U34)-methyltransferase
LFSRIFRTRKKNRDINQWRFDKGATKIFEGHIRKHTPFYEEMHRMITELSDWFLRDSSIVYDLGTSTGEGIRRIYERHSDKKLKFVAVDKSEEMVNKAKNNLSQVPNVEFHVHDLNKTFTIKNASVVLSILTLQFLEPNSRPRLLKEVFDGLEFGGAFILVEKVLGNTPKFDEIWTDLHHDMKRRKGLNDEEIAIKRQSLRGILLPYSFGKNMQLINEAGFQDVDIFFKWYNWIGIVATK